MKTKELIEKIEKTKSISEKEIMLLRRRMNEGEQICVCFDDLIKITDKEQETKGLNWLNNLRKTPAGKERKNNPFGTREEEALNNFSHFGFDGFLYNCPEFYLPIYSVYGKSGEYFQYYVAGGKINING